MFGFIEVTNKPDSGGIFLSILITFLLGFFVKPILDTFTSKPDPPEGAYKENWKRVTKRGKGGSFVGFLERYISLAAFWAGDYKIIGGWLVFKVAVKWEAWKNVVQVPPKLKVEAISELEYLGARNSWGSSLFERFLSGTVLNIFCGFLAYYAVRNKENPLVYILFWILLFSLLVYSLAERNKVFKWISVRWEGVEKFCIKLKNG